MKQAYARPVQHLFFAPDSRPRSLFAPDSRPRSLAPISLLTTSMMSESTPLTRTASAASEGTESRGKRGRDVLAAVRDAMFPLGVFQAAIVALYGTCTCYNSGASSFPANYNMYKVCAWCSTRACLTIVVTITCSSLPRSGLPPNFTVCFPLNSYYPLLHFK